MRNSLENALNPVANFEIFGRKNSYKIEVDNLTFGRFGEIRHSMRFGAQSLMTKVSKMCLKLAPNQEKTVPSSSDTTENTATPATWSVASTVFTAGKISKSSFVA